MLFLADLGETDKPWPYQQIAPMALQLHRLGLSNLRIAQKLHVNDKTVGKALAWIRTLQKPSDGP